MDRLKTRAHWIYTEFIKYIDKNLLHDVRHTGSSRKHLYSNSETDIQCEGLCPCERSVAVPNECVCTMEFKPVCGVNNETYGNKCGANCAKVPVACNGECPCKKECICTTDYRPVCGMDKQTYGNKCAADCQ